MGQCCGTLLLDLAGHPGEIRLRISAVLYAHAEQPRSHRATMFSLRSLRSLWWQFVTPTGFAWDCFTTLPAIKCSHPASRVVPLLLDIRKTAVKTLLSWDPVGRFLLTTIFPAHQRHTAFTHARFLFPLAQSQANTLSRAAKKRMEQRHQRHSFAQRATD